MTYTVEIRPAAARQIKKLTRIVQEQVIQQLEELELEPRPPDVKKLSGKNNLYRVRIAKAREAAVIANAVEPRAQSAYYDQSSDRIVINLKSGATYSFPPTLAQGLAGASPEDLAEVEVTPSGDGLHWEKLDAAFSIPALLGGVFGTAAWMAQIKMKAS